MKFTKTIARALANKVSERLIKSRKQFINDFKLPKDEEKELKGLISELFALDKRIIEVRATLQNKVNVSKSYYDTEETYYDKCRAELAGKKLNFLPNIDTLTDDFLIESLDSASPEDLIARVSARYEMNI